MSDTAAVMYDPDGGVVPPLSLGVRLWIARQKRDGFAGLDQGELADALGIARTSISRYESGKYRPTLAVVLSWAMVTGVSSRWLRGDDFPSTRKGAPLPFGKRGSDHRRRRPSTAPQDDHGQRPGKVVRLMAGVA